MSTSALAAGREAEKINHEYVQAFINETQLNHKQTWSEFYQKTKASYPQEISNKIKEFADLNPDLLLPEVKLKAAQNSNGKQTSVLEVFDHGKTHTIQLIGETDKWAKIDGITLRESDIENPANGLIRLQTSNIYLKNEADDYFAKHNVLPDPKVQTLKADFSRFNGFPRVTPQLWSSLSKSQRKEFIKQIADVWSKAAAVNSLKTSGKIKKTSLLENYLKHFLLADALADDLSGPSYDGTKANVGRS